MLFLVAALASAATLTVDLSGGADHATIQRAIDAAADGDRIEVAPGTYAESIDFGGRDLVVVGTGGPALTIIDPAGGAFAAVLETAEPATALLEGFRLVAGTDGALRVAGGASPTLRNIVVRDGAVPDRSEVYLIDGAAATFDDCVFADNASTALSVSGADATIIASSFERNHSSINGGAIYVQQGNLDVTDSSFVDNSAWSAGGAVHLTSDSSATLTESSFRGNEATRALGSGAADGGAVFARWSDLTVQDCLFEGNRAQYGAHLMLGSGTGVVDGTEWREGDASLGGA